MFRRHRTIRYIWVLNTLVMLVMVLCGCRGATPTPSRTPEAIAIAATSPPSPEVATVVVTPVVTILRNPDITEVLAGQEVAISAEASGPSLQFKWQVVKGRLSRTEGPSVIYTAPDAPGIDTVDVTVTSAGGSTTRTVTFTVIPSPSETPASTPTPTPQPTKTATAMPSATHTPTPPTPTEPPAPETCSLVSVRPPISGPEITDLEAEILLPAHCSMGLPSAEAIRSGGIYSGNLDGREIWVLVYPEDGKYYPQSPEACDELPAQASGERWATRLFLGRKGVSEQFDIVVTVADVDSEASRSFKDWLRTGCDTGEYPGFAVLPDGLAELDAITVHTK